MNQQLLRVGLWVAIAATSAGLTCKVPNADHCANQDIPGNRFCAEISSATPFCSPCRRSFRGCVDFEPYACPGYVNVIAEESSSSGMVTAGTELATESSSTTAGAPTSTGGD